MSPSRPDLATLARVSYLAELRGKLDVALCAMQQAAESPGLAPENTAFVERCSATCSSTRAIRQRPPTRTATRLGLVPDHAPSLAGQGRLAVGAGDLDEAIELFQRAADIVPLPEYVIALGEPRRRPAKVKDAARSYDLARAEIQLFQATGVIVDIDLALFEADHGDPAHALELAKAAYEATPRCAPPTRWPGRCTGSGRDAEAGRAPTRRCGWARSTRSSATTRGDRGGARGCHGRSADLGWRSPPTRVLGDRGGRGTTAARLARPRLPSADRRRSSIFGTLRITGDSIGRRSRRARAGQPITGPEEDRRACQRRHRERDSCPPVPSTAGIRRPPHRGDVDQRRLRVQPPRGAADRGRSRRGQHGPVRVRQPRQARHRDDHRQLHSARGAGRRPELLPVRPRRPLRDPRRQQRRRQDRHHLHVPVHDPIAQGDELAGIPTFLYNDGPITSLTDAEPARQPDLRRRAERRDGSRTDIPTPPANIGPRSTPDYAALAARRRQDARQRDQGLRRPARRPVLRRPRLDLRPGRPAPVQRAPRDPAPGRGRASTASAASTPTRSPSRSRSST